ncbi:unnamed protein product [Ceratitis capitata]|uniref:(Mediterranean fruit fly) hypothetical protein n=1 Tax=Ceratitis capitata TaxID=7213 RepID=A0A811VD60_CERCA|nr:unnamed protein product [Ceratitis capitata]
MSTDSKQRIQVPEALREVLLEFSIAYLLEQPGDVVDYAVQYFNKLQSNRQAAANFYRPDSPESSIMSQEEEDQVFARIHQNVSQS